MYRQFRNSLILIAAAWNIATAPTVLAQGVSVGATVPAASSSSGTGTSSVPASSATTTPSNVPSPATSSNGSATSSAAESQPTPTSSTTQPTVEQPLTPTTIRSLWPPRGNDLWWYLLGCLTVFLIWVVGEILHSVYRFAILRRTRPNDRL